MHSFHQIVLPTDFSELSIHAAGFGRMMADAHHAALHVVHVFSSAEIVLPAAMPEAGMMPIVPGVPDLLKQAEESLDRFVRDRLSALASPVVTKVLVGVPAREISRYAEEVKADLIVIGTHARGMMKRIVLGSVSKSVLECSPCPVLMVPLAAMEPSGAASAP